MQTNQLKEEAIIPTWNRTTFITNLRQVRAQYIQRHNWFNGAQYGAGNAQAHNINRFQPYENAAWKVYEHAHNLGLDFILLGDTAIRQEYLNIFNFGIVSSNTQPQDPEFANMVDDTIRERRAIGARTNYGIYSPRGIVSTTETGSILSTQNWSPILNDCLIIAGVQAGLDFCYTLSEDEAGILRNVELRQRLGGQIPPLAQTLQTTPVAPAIVPTAQAQPTQNAGAVPVAPKP